MDEALRFLTHFCKIILMPSHAPLFLFVFFGWRFLVCFLGVCLVWFGFDFYSCLSPMHKFLHDQVAFVCHRHLSTVKKMEKNGEE